MFEERITAYLWEHLGTVLGTVVLAFLTTMQGLILRWRKQSLEDRELARNSHQKLSERVAKIDEACKSIANMAALLATLKNDQAMLSQKCEILLTRGPRDIQNQLNNLKDEISKIGRTRNNN